MNKNTIVIFFTLLFMAIITAPSIIVALDDTIDSSIFFSLNEEEEENGEAKNIKIVIATEYVDYLLFQDLNALQYLGDSQKNYLNPYLKLLSPPPKSYIL